MTKFFLFSLGFVWFFFRVFILTMCFVTGETALDAWAGGTLFSLAGCIGVGKLLDCNV